MGVVFSRSRDCATRSVAGETVIVPIRAQAAAIDCLYTLNGTASAVWERLDSPRSAEELAGALVGHFDVLPERAAADVAALLATLEQAGLVERQPSP